MDDTSYERLLIERRAHGVVLLTLALLRGLQTIETINQPGRVHGGTWSWVPYVGALVWLLLVTAVAANAAKRGGDKRRK